MSTSDDIRVEVWTKDPTRLSQVVGGTPRGSGTVSRESKEADWGVKLASEAIEEDVSKTSWGATEGAGWISPRGGGEKQELGRFESMKFSFRWAAWGWATFTGELTRLLFFAADWEQEGRAQVEASFIRKASKSLKGGFDDTRLLWRATWFVWDVADAVRGAAQAGVVSSADIRGGESPQNKEWGDSSVAKESERGAVTKQEDVKCPQDEPLEEATAVARVEDERQVLLTGSWIWGLGFKEAEREGSAVRGEAEAWAALPSKPAWRSAAWVAEANLHAASWWQQKGSWRSRATV